MGRFHARVVNRTQTHDCYGDADGVPALLERVEGAEGSAGAGEGGGQRPVLGHDLVLPAGFATLPRLDRTRLLAVPEARGVLVVLVWLLPVPPVCLLEGLVWLWGIRSAFTYVTGGWELGGTDAVRVGEVPGWRVLVVGEGVDAVSGSVCRGLWCRDGWAGSGFMWGTCRRCCRARCVRPRFRRSRGSAVLPALLLSRPGGVVGVFQRCSCLPCCGSGQGRRALVHSLIDVPGLGCGGC